MAGHPFLPMDVGKREEAHVVSGRRVTRPGIKGGESIRSSDVWLDGDKRKRSVNTCHQRRGLVFANHLIYTLTTHIHH